MALYLPEALWGPVQHHRCNIISDDCCECLQKYCQELSVTPEFALRLKLLLLQVAYRAIFVVRIFALARIITLYPAVPLR